MLIQNNTNSFLTKYFSIFLKETFNDNVTVDSLYNNSTFNYYSNGTNVIITGYVAYPVIINNVFQYYNYAYVLGASGTIVKNPYTYLDSETGRIVEIPMFDPYLPFDTELDFNNYIKIDFENSLVIQIDIMTGELLTDANNKNYLTYNNSLTENNIFLASSANCRNQDSLCNYIYQYLNLYYPSLFNEEVYGNKMIFDNNIANYFAGMNENFNSNKLNFDIDDLIGSFLFGRTITNTSTPDEIEYAQNLISNNFYINQLLIAQDDNITNYIKHPGMWDNLHLLIYKYQTYLNEKYSLNKNDTVKNIKSNIIIPTGYLDIITEKYLLSEFEGDAGYGYYRESENILRSN